MEKIIKTEEQWRQELDPAAYEVLRHQATERPWTGKYVNEKGDGVYRCAGCGNALFNADTKFESGSGWPSFTDPMFGEAVETSTDTSHGMVRTEVTCAQCGGHLGHVFDDGPGDSGLRYCINSCALDLDRQRRGVIARRDPPQAAGAAASPPVRPRHPLGPDGQPLRLTDPSSRRVHPGL